MNSSWASRRRCRSAATNKLDPRLVAVVVQDLGPVVALRVGGDIDMASAPVLAARLEELIRSGKRHIIVDLERVTLFGADALRVLARTHRQLEALGGSVCLVCTKRLPIRVLAVTGMGHLFHVYRDVGTALRETAGERVTEAQRSPR